MRKLGKITLTFIFSIFFILISSNFTFAQSGLEVAYPEIGGVRPQDTSFALPDYVKYIFNFSLAIAGLVAFTILIYGGFRYLTSAGNPASQKDARDRIFAAILGLITLFSSYLILTTINPQLVFLSIPERVVFTQEYINKVEPREKETLYYTEIPIGGLIEELFSKMRTDNIEKVSKNLKTISEDISDKAEGINSLTSQCACSISSPECSGECSAGSCVGDPCPARGEINQKRGEISKIISDTEATTTIQYWQKKLDVEINGSSEEKIIGFKQVYEDLKKAEDLIKNCSLSSSPRGNTQTLLGYNDFWQYRQKLEEEQSIKKTEPTYPFDYISSDNTYYLATFYCVEVFYSITPEPINEESFSQTGKEIEAVLGSEEEICSSEIPIGEAVDNAEELAGKILTELENIKNNISKEIIAAQNLIELSNPEDCVAANCYSNCTWIEQQCWEPSACPEEPPPEDIWDWFFFKPGYSFAAEDCGQWVDCSYCEIPECSGSSCLDNKPQIGVQVAEIKNSDSQIASSYEQVKNFIEEKEIEDKLKISNILASLKTAKNQLGVCYNSKEAQRKGEAGEKTLWRELYSCSNLKEAIQGQNLFYDESGQEINDCYGPTPDAPDLLDNFLCCESEIF